MGGTRSRTGLALAIAAAVFGGWVSQASAETTIVSSAEGYSYEPGPYIQGLGEIAKFDNSLSSAPHDVSSTQVGPDGKALFFSDVLLGGQSALVQGTQYLAAGNYPFICVIHGAAMSGELVIDGRQGRIVKRPGVRPTIAKQKLKQVRKRGIKVKLKALGASRQVTVTASKGKSVLGSKRLNFKAGQVRTLTIPLTKKGKQAIRRGKSVKVKVRTSVAFGKPQQATRKLK